MSLSHYSQIFISSVIVKSKIVSTFHDFRNTLEIRFRCFRTFRNLHVYLHVVIGKYLKE